MIATLLLQAVPGDGNAGALALCLAMTIGLLFFVFYLPPQVAAAPRKTRLAFLQERKDVVYENLRDLNFEHKAGKIADADYQEMSNALEQDAAALLAEIEDLEKRADAPRLSPGLSKTPLRGARP